MRNPIKLNRREMMAQSAGALLAAGLWPGALRAGDANATREFHFLVVNDTHYQDQRCGKWLQQVFRHMKGHKEKIDFCLLAGDLVEHGKTDELSPLRDLLKEFGLPTYVVPGNHDYLTQDDRKPYEEMFPKRINYHFEHQGWQFLGLDTTEGLRFQKTKVQPATLRWLDESLPKLDKKRPTVVFTHFPIGPMTPSRPLNAEEVLARFKEFNLQAVFSGHFHGFTERQAGTITLTTNRCCSFSRGNHDGTKEKGYFLCQAKDGKVHRTSVEAKVS